MMLVRTSGNKKVGCVEKRRKSTTNAAAETEKEKEKTHLHKKNREKKKKKRQRKERQTRDTRQTREKRREADSRRRSRLLVARRHGAQWGPGAGCESNGLKLPRETSG
eukprot:1080338-Rhodomonas_salina.1